MITRNLIEKYLSDKLGDFRKTHQGLAANCPKCDRGNKYNLEISLEKGIMSCWSCRYGGYIRKLFVDYACDDSWRQLAEFQYRHDNDTTEEEQQVINYPESTVPFFYNKEVTDYLVKKRGMDKEELKRRKVAYVHSETETYFDHICFPFYEDGQIVGACLQNFKTKRYRNLGKFRFVPYMEYINPRYPITITEGCYDALSGVNAIPLLSTEISKPILEFLHDKDVILAIDNTVEVSQYLSQMKKLEKANVRNLILFDLYEYKDMNEFYLGNKKKFLSEYKACLNKLK